MTTYWLCTSQLFKAAVGQAFKNSPACALPNKTHRFYTFLYFVPQRFSTLWPSFHALRHSLEGLNQPTGLSFVSPSTFSLFWLAFAFCTEQVFNNDSENKTWKGRDSAGDSCPSSLITPVAMSEEGETIQSSPLTYSIFDLLAGDTKLPLLGGGNWSQLDNFEEWERC